MAWLYTMEQGKIQKFCSYCAAFGRNVVDKVQIAAIGSGGKSTILSEIASEYQNAGRSVVSTTTTHIWKPDAGVWEETIEKVKEALSRTSIVIVGNDLDGGQKLSAVSFGFLAQLRTVADCVLVEADGSRQLPLKMPNEREPVIPPNTDLTVVVAGVSALGKPIGEVIHRPELAANVLHKSLDQIVDEVDISVLLHCQAKRSRAIPLLNQVDTKEDWTSACKIASFLPYCVIRSQLDFLHGESKG